VSELRQASAQADGDAGDRVQGRRLVQDRQPARAEGRAESKPGDASKDTAQKDTAQKPGAEPKPAAEAKPATDAKPAGGTKSGGSSKADAAS